MEKTTKKEVLHTQGEWKLGGRLTNSSVGLTIETDNVGHIAEVFHIGIDNETGKANAELICKAVNNYQNLLDSNKELIEALELAKDIMTTYKLMDSKAGIRVETAINNAKNNIV